MQFDTCRKCVSFVAGLFLVVTLVVCQLEAQSKPTLILGGTLIDGTGGPLVIGAAILVEEGRFQRIGKRGEIPVPTGADVIEAGGKTILPGFIDGHCHYQDWIGELHLAFGVTTCPDVSKNDLQWMVAQREAVQKGTVRGPRLWVTGYNVDGPPIAEMRERRRQRTGVVVESAEEARKAVQELVGQGVDGLKFYERLTPELAQAAAAEAERLGKPVISHSLDVLAAAQAGFQSVEHSWAIAYTSIEDLQKRRKLDADREAGRLSTVDLHRYMEPAAFDSIVQALVQNNVHWSPTWATTFRLYSPHAAAMRKRERAIVQDSRLNYSGSDLENVYEAFDSISAQERVKTMESYRKLQDFVRRFAAAGGKIDSGSDPHTLPPAYAVHLEIQLLVEAGIHPLQAIRTASLNVAETWKKDADYGSVEEGKVADFFIVTGDPVADISATQNVEMVFMEGRLVSGSAYR